MTARCRTQKFELIQFAAPDTERITAKQTKKCGEQQQSIVWKVDLTRPTYQIGYSQQIAIRQRYIKQPNKIFAT